MLPKPGSWNFLKPFIEEHDAAIFTIKKFVPDSLSLARVEYIPPVIDLRTSRNRDLPEDLCRQVVIEYGVDSIREGFGLTLSEALWKGAIVIGGNTGEVPLQTKDGQNDYLVDLIVGCVKRVMQIMENFDTHREFRQCGKEWVKDHCLITRLISDQIRFFHSLV